MHIDRSLVVKYGLSQHLASIITINIPVLSLEAQEKRTVTALLRAVQRAVRLDSAQAVVLGCTGMSSLVTTLKNRLGDEGLSVPIIEPLRAAVYNAVVLAGHSHSKEAFMQPRAKQRLIARA